MRAGDFWFVKGYYKVNDVNLRLVRPTIIYKVRCFFITFKKVPRNFFILTISTIRMKLEKFDWFD